jgi:hypothetical protein
VLTLPVYLLIRRAGPVGLPSDTSRWGWR